MRLIANILRDFTDEQLERVIQDGIAAEHDRSLTPEMIQLRQEFGVGASQEKAQRWEMRLRRMHKLNQVRELTHAMAVQGIHREAMLEEYDAAVAETIALQQKVAVTA